MKREEDLMMMNTKPCGMNNKVSGALLKNNWLLNLKQCTACSVKMKICLKLRRRKWSLNFLVLKRMLMRWVLVSDSKTISARKMIMWVLNLWTMGCYRMRNSGLGEMFRGFVSCDMMYREGLVSSYLVSISLPSPNIWGSLTWGDGDTWHGPWVALGLPRVPTSCVPCLCWMPDIIIIIYRHVSRWRVSKLMRLLFE